MAEKLAWGYEGSDPNPEGAFRLFEQAADLGVSDALIRVGQFQEYGKGTARDLKAALQNYLKAAKSGNYCAHAFLAIMLSRGSQLEASSKQWNLFFIAFESNPDATFQVASRGELLHDYIAAQLRLGFEPEHLGILERYRLEIVGHHQQLLEHASEQALDIHEPVSKWMETNLGPWPARI